jgi:DNA mismatch repair protein MutS
MMKGEIMKKSTAPYTPMMMQYLRIKDKHADMLIFFRLGDFYELFFEDAKIASRELSLVLTGKSAGQDERVPMCGVPYHASKGYIKKLIEKGYKVGIVEQLEEASAAKGLVQRDVTHIYTPGSFVESTDKAHNFLVAISEDTLRYVLVFGDITTGDVYLDYLEKQLDVLLAYLQKLNCHEIVVNDSLRLKLNDPCQQLNIAVSIQEDGSILDQKEPFSDLEKMTYQRWLDYLQSTQKRSLTFLRPLIRMDRQSTLKIDSVSLANLEVLKSIKHQTTYGSLFWLLDETLTPMGSRLLTQWLIRPSTHLPTIRMRHGLIDTLLKNFLSLESIRSLLKEVYDIPRIVMRIQFMQANARDLLSLKQTLNQLPALRSLLLSFDAPLAKILLESLPVFPDVVALLTNAIHEEPPVSLKEGNLIKVGYDAELDRWLSLAKDGKKSLLALEANERIRTGIKNVKVGYNQVFGYYLEVSNGQLGSIKPEYGYERRQTLANAERFITKELKALESDLLHAEDMQKQLEEKIFLSIVLKLQTYTTEFQTLADTLAYLDVMASFAIVSGQYQFVSPIIHDEKSFDIEQSRHPVIEKVMKKSVFVANDFQMDAHTNTILLTGPNMGGKSTFMRQIALLMIMAQIGCYVPAKRAEIMWVDAIYTRIGASDDLVGGQSTFMMEMTQTQYALANASDRSFLIFDEIGRGTATFDGMALAQAIIEYATKHIQAKTLFSTHYHELTQLEQTLPLLKNMHVAVHEENDQVTFLYKVRHGSMSRSFGIHVAQLALLPNVLIQRAKSILTMLETQPSILPVQDIQPVISPLEKALKQIDPLTLSPMQALEVLMDLKKKQG